MGPGGDGADPAAGVLPAGPNEALSSVTERFADSSSFSKNGSYRNYLLMDSGEIKDLRGWT